jgi:cell division protein FtsZ
MKKKLKIKKLKISLHKKAKKTQARIKIKKISSKPKEVFVKSKISKEMSRMAKVSHIKVKTFSGKKDKKTSIPKIKVIGIGGGGGNAISRMYDYFPKSVDLIAINTDAQDLEYCHAKKRLVIGKSVTKGLGAGMNPEVGRLAAEESREEIAQLLSGADMIFLTSGFGGGTGSGATPVIAEIAQEMGILTSAIVTKPFSFEGIQRAQIAQDAIIKLKDRVDSFITVSNDKIFSVIDKDTSMHKAFEAIDEVLKNAVLGVAELIISPGIINVDFADIKSIMQNSGAAIIGVGIAGGKERATNASNIALNSPLLENVIDGAKGVLFSVSGHKDLKMSEINDIARLISESVDPGAKIIFGTYHDKKLNKGQIKVTLIATGFGSSYGRNYSLFTDFESFSKGGSIFQNSGEVPNAKQSLKKEEKKEIIIPQKSRAEEQEEEDEAWDIPTFLRKKGKKK